MLPHRSADRSGTRKLESEVKDPADRYKSCDLTTNTVLQIYVDSRRCRTWAEAFVRLRKNLLQQSFCRRKNQKLMAENESLVALNGTHVSLFVSVASFVFIQRNPCIQIYAFIKLSCFVVSSPVSCDCVAKVTGRSLPTSTSQRRKNYAVVLWCWCVCIYI